MKTTIKKWKVNRPPTKPRRKEVGTVGIKNPVIFEEPRQVELDRQDYDDLIAWKRNRKELKEKQSTMFFYLGLAIALLMVIIAFEWRFQNDALVTELSMNDTEWEEVQDIPLTSQPPPPPPQQIIQQAVFVEVPDEEIIEDLDIEIDVEVTEEMAVEEVEFVMEEIEEEEAEEIFMVVEEKPEPKGGVKAFYQYVAESIKYPRMARENGIEGRVYVQFIVNKEGKISDVIAVKGIGNGCDEEAVRIVAQAADWYPGKQRGVPVKVRMVLPITFKLYR